LLISGGNMTNKHDCQQQLRDREYELQVLHEIGVAVSSHLRLSEVLNLVADKVRQLVGAETLLIPLLSQSRESYTYAAVSGKNAESIVNTSFPISIGMCGWVLSNNRPLLYGESDAYSFNQKTPWEPGRPSLVLIPLNSRNQIIGGLSCTGKVDGESFTLRDMNLLKLISAQVGIAIENARLFDEVNSLVNSLELKVQERTLELQASNRELESFAYSVSHDLRAPLRSIDGFSQALLEDYAGSLDVEGKEFLERLRANSMRMGQLIDAMLTLSRVTRSEMKKTMVDISGLAKELAQNLMEAEPNRKVDFEIEPDLMVQGDPVLLDALFTNLLSNAWKYTGNTDKAIISLFRTEKDGKPCYCIRDNGVGFDMARTAKLFQPFQRMHAVTEFEGTGVGLATVQRIINRHGGWIWASGSVFFYACPGRT
jgi:signal transduction histidine kinase